jgi:16S rRNA (guanine1207-N2)-methyltransferase
MSMAIQLIQLFNKILPTEPCIEDIRNLLLLGSEGGILLSEISKFASINQVWVTDSTASSINSTLENVRANNFQNIHVFPDTANPDTFLLAPPVDRFDAAIIILPKGRKVARRWILQAYQWLADSGILYLAGANDEGIQSVAKDASEVFGETNVLGYKKGSRIYRCVKTKSIEHSPEWTREPGIAADTWNEFNVEIHGRVYVIRTLPGVFSFDHLDEGTKMLLDCMQIPAGGRVLDLGSGCGVIGIVAADLGAGHVDLADDHLLSVRSSLENLRINKISNACVYASDLYKNLPTVIYDMILSNPPYHAGKNVNYEMTNQLIEQSYQRLVRGGSLLIVANRFIRYERLMNQIFNNVSILQESGKFHLLSSRKE